MLTTPSPVNTAFTTSPAPLGPSKRLVAKTALLHLLSTNVELFGTFVDQCYSTDSSVSRAYFQVPAAQQSSLLNIANHKAHCVSIDPTPPVTPTGCAVVPDAQCHTALTLQPVAALQHRLQSVCDCTVTVSCSILSWWTATSLCCAQYYPYGCGVTVLCRTLTLHHALS